MSLVSGVIPDGRISRPRRRRCWLSELSGKQWTLRAITMTPVQAVPHHPAAKKITSIFSRYTIVQNILDQLDFMNGSSSIKKDRNKLCSRPSLNFYILTLLPQISNLTSSYLTIYGEKLLPRIDANHGECLQPFSLESI